MGIEFSSNFGDISKQIFAQAADQVHEAMAQGLAEKAREHGMSTADTIKLETSSDSAEFAIDAERVRARANEILAAD